MGSYDTMQVCVKCGHQITTCYDSFPAHRQGYCEECGNKTVFQCPSCNEKIRGFYHMSGVTGGSNPEVPMNCHNCGKDYPWKKILLRKNRPHNNLNRWNYSNLFWWIWKLLNIAWEHKIISGIIIAITAAYFIWRFGWN